MAVICKSSEANTEFDEFRFQLWNSNFVFWIISLILSTNQWNKGIHLRIWIGGLWHLTGVYSIKTGQGQLNGCSHSSSTQLRKERDARAPPGCLTLKMTKNLTSDATFSVSDVSEEGSHFEWKRQFKHKQTFDFSVQDLL